MIEGQNCQNCLYVVGMTNIGTCHRQSPSRDRDDYVGNGRWPQVWDHNWCGEWKPDASIAGQVIYGAIDKWGNPTITATGEALNPTPRPHMLTRFWRLIT